MLGSAILLAALSTSPAGMPNLPLTFSSGARIPQPRRFLSSLEVTLFPAVSTWLRQAFPPQRGSGHSQLPQEKVGVHGEGPQGSGTGIRFRRSFLKAVQLCRPSLAHRWAPVQGELLIEFTLVKNANKLPMTS